MSFNHICFYLSMTACFGLQRPSAGNGELPDTRQKVYIMRHVGTVSNRSFDFFLLQILFPLFYSVMHIQATGNNTGKILLLQLLLLLLLSLLSPLLFTIMYLKQTMFLVYTV